MFCKYFPLKAFYLNKSTKQKKRGQAKEQLEKKIISSDSEISIDVVDKS